MKNNEYLEEFKIDLVKQYLQGKQKKDICKEYCVAKSTMREWICKYASLIEKSREVKGIEAIEEEYKDGHLELSNNSAKRGVKPFVMIRKNFLFSNTSSGAESSVIIFSILQTAVANGIDAELYLKTLVEKIGTNPSNEELENLLPWKINLGK